LSSLISLLPVRPSS